MIGQVVANSTTENARIATPRPGTSFLPSVTRSVVIRPV
jgi:hypothetical protein